MNKKKFIVSGYKPAYGQEVNEFIKMCDLGTEGAFVKFSDEIMVTYKDGVTEDHITKTPDVLKKAYESTGCTNINVVAA